MRNPYKIVVGQLQENKLHEGQRKSERMIFELILKWLSLMV